MQSWRFLWLPLCCFSVFEIHHPWHTFVYCFNFVRRRLESSQWSFCFPYRNWGFRLALCNTIVKLHGGTQEAEWMMESNIHQRLAHRSFMTLFEKRRQYIERPRQSLTTSQKKWITLRNRFLLILNTMFLWSRHSKYFVWEIVVLTINNCDFLCHQSFSELFEFCLVH